MATPSIIPYLPSTRPTRTGPLPFVERARAEPPKVEDGIAGLSLESRLDLSQKVGATPPPPPTHTKKPASTQPKKPPQKQDVEAKDYTGRTATGTLHGPLLMEEPAIEEMAAASAGAFRTVDFRFEGPNDFHDLRGASILLGSLPADALHAPASDTPQVGSSFSYYGVKNGVAVVVQHFEPGSLISGESSVGLPDGGRAQIVRSESDITTRLPASSLDGLAEWGRSLLAVA